jgi:hypothetical protein
MNPKERTPEADGIMGWLTPELPPQQRVLGRINAEDPERNFLPTPGVLDELTLPAGPFTRVDTHGYPGYAHYPPIMIPCSRRSDFCGRCSAIRLFRSDRHATSLVDHMPEKKAWQFKVLARSSGKKRPPRTRRRARRE